VELLTDVWLYLSAPESLPAWFMIVAVFGGLTVYIGESLGRRD
jgi:hypothetical protein